MVRADIGDDRHIVVVIAESSQQDAAASGLEDRQLHARLGQDAAGSAEARPIPRLDQLTADVDPVRVGHARNQARF